MMKGQISAEMLIILAIVIAIAVVLVSQLMSTSESMSDSIDESTDTIGSQTQSLRIGMYCKQNSDCGGNLTCDTSINECVN